MTIDVPCYGGDRLLQIMARLPNLAVLLTHCARRFGLGRDFSVLGGLGRVGSTIAKVLKFERIMLMHSKHG